VIVRQAPRAFARNQAKEVGQPAIWPDALNEPLNGIGRAPVAFAADHVQRVDASVVQILRRR
jgi:hypothetical protein